MNVRDQIESIEQSAEQRRGDVVGQIADHAPGTVRQQILHRHRQHVSADQLQVRKALLQRWHQVPIDLDSAIALRLAVQCSGQRPLPGSNLEQRVGGRQLERAADLREHKIVTQKMLAKALAGPRRSAAPSAAPGAATHGSFIERNIARPRAACRLPA